MSVGEILAAIPTQSQDLRERGYKFRQTKALNDAWRIRSTRLVVLTK